MPEKSLLPFLILGFGFVWAGCFEWLRRRSGATESAAGSHHLVLIGMAGLLVCMVAAAVAASAKWF